MRLHVLLIGSALVTASCSETPRESEQPSVQKQDKSFPSVFNEDKAKHMFAGGGLKGVPLFPRTVFESPSLTTQLFETAYADAGGAPGIVERDGIEYDARPAASFRVSDSLILLVSHKSAEEIHVYSGGYSVFYFDAAGRRVLKSFPFSIGGTSWGGSGELELVRLPDGRPATVSMGGGTWQGCTVSFFKAVSFAPEGLVQMGEFPDYYSNEGAGGEDEVKMAGAEFTAGDDGLLLHYTGQESGEDGVSRPVDLQPTFRLDGRNNEWAKEWKYAC